MLSEILHAILLYRLRAAKKKTHEKYCAQKLCGVFFLNLNKQPCKQCMYFISFGQCVLLSFTAWFILTLFARQLLSFAVSSAHSLLSFFIFTCKSAEQTGRYTYIYISIYRSETAKSMPASLITLKMFHGFTTEWDQLVWCK